MEGNSGQSCLAPSLIDVCSQASLSMLHGQICVDIQVFVVAFVHDTGVAPDMWSNIAIHLDSS